MNSTDDTLNKQRAQHRLILHPRLLPSYALFQTSTTRTQTSWSYDRSFSLHVFSRVDPLPFCQPHSHSATSVTNTSQFILIMQFVASANFHINAVWLLPVSGDAKSLDQHILPTHSSAPPTIEPSVTAFVKYDFHFTGILPLLVTSLTGRFKSIWNNAGIAVAMSVGCYSCNSGWNWSVEGR